MFNLKFHSLSGLKNIILVLFLSLNYIKNITNKLYWYTVTQSYKKNRYIHSLR